MTSAQLVRLQGKHTEITDASYYAFEESVGVTLPLEPDTAGAVTDPPNVWRVSHLAFYPT